jgi:YD repeat-containing protein
MVEFRNNGLHSGCRETPQAVDERLNRVTTITPDARGNPTQIVRPNGTITTMTYDAKGNLLPSTEQAIAAATTFTYEPTDVTPVLSSAAIESPIP